MFQRIEHWPRGHNNNNNNKKKKKKKKKKKNLVFRLLPYFAMLHVSEGRASAIIMGTDR